MKKLILAIMPALLLLLLPASIQAQDAREGTLGIRLDGGLSWSLGGDFANSGKNALTLIQLISAPVSGWGWTTVTRGWSANKPMVR